MKRTLITPDIDAFPIPLRHFLEGARLFDSSCSPEAWVVFVDKDQGYYLKSASKGALAKETALTRYFHGKGLGTEVLDYLSDERDWLLTARLSGEDCTHARYLEDPKRLCDLLAEALRELHGTDPVGCPVPDRTTEYLAIAERNYRAGVFDAAYLPDDLCHLTADEAWRFLAESKHLLKSDTLLHGDYCLPNILLDGWRFSGFIDLGNGGVGDRHIDLFWGAWTLAYNLKTHAYGGRFLDAYGRDAVEPELLRVVAAAEAFG